MAAPAYSKRKPSERKTSRKTRNTRGNYAPNVNARDIDIIVTNVFKRDIIPAKSETNENRLRFALSMFPGPWKGYFRRH